MRMLLVIGALVGISHFAQAQVQTSANTCYAYTDCYDYYGRYTGRVTCQVYGYAALYGYGSTGSSCQFQVQPGVAVYCAGYQQSYNSYTGQTQWAWQNFTSRCPGR